MPLPPAPNFDSDTINTTVTPSALPLFAVGGMNMFMGLLVETFFVALTGCGLAI